MHTYIIHITLLALCYSVMFRPSKGHLHAVQLIHFRSQINKLCTRCKILEVKTYLQVKLQ
jgi:hypothetical protein